MLFTHKLQPQLISIHIPKTAGTSFRNILKNVYGENDVVRFDIDPIGGINMNEKPYLKKNLPEVKVIHGHFSYESLVSNFTLPDNYKIISWVRDPVKRVISNFFYLESVLKNIINEEKRNVNILSKLQRTLIEYSRADINRNRQSKFLSGNRLEKYDFIGIQELFGEEVSRLSGVLEWKKLPEVLFQNKTPGENQNVPNDVMEEIKSLNMDDVQLYNEAMKIRNSKLIG